MKNPRSASQAPAAEGDAPPSGAPKPDELEGTGFEEGIARLESVVEQLETGDLALEEALAAFEQGVGLARALAERLTRAEQRVDVLLREGDEARVRPLDEVSGDDEEGGP